jgi:histidyl-tRNA synthetase
VRGLDYYTRTLFEFQVSTLGAQNAIGGGGRYDNLIEELGGAPTPALGFGSGIERLALTLKAQNISVPQSIKSPIALVAQGEKCIRRVILLSEELRQKGIPVELDHRFGSFKSQLKFADKLGSSHVLILGENELAKNVILLKTMSSGEQKEIPLDQITSTLIPLIS